MSEWIYNGKPVTEKDIEGFYGYVYEIESLVTGKKYIGKKLLWHKKIKIKNGKKKRYLAESDWKTYWGSNKLLLEDIKTQGEEKFKRTILQLCKSKGETSYIEAKYQFDKNVLKDKNFYNDLIRVRIHSSHVRDEKEAEG
jgi:hypothetical protein